VCLDHSLGDQRERCGVHMASSVSSTLRSLVDDGSALGLVPYVTDTAGGGRR
jgi:hypothetical protein